MSLIKANAHQVGDYTLTNEGGKLVVNQGTPDTVLNPVATFGLDGLEVDGKLLSGTSGSSLVGYDTGTVQDVLDGAKQLQDYAVLRAYTGRATRIYITGLLATAKPAGIAGVFQYDPTDTTSPDDGATVIVLADGRRFKRDFDGAVNVKWFGAVGNYVSSSSRGTNDRDAFIRFFEYCKTNKRKGFIPKSSYYIGTPLPAIGETTSSSTLLGNFAIEGEDAHSTTLVFDITDNNDVAFQIAPDSSGWDMKNFGIRNITSKKGVGFYIPGSYDSKFENIQVFGFDINWKKRSFVTTFINIEGANGNCGFYDLGGTSTLVISSWMNYNTPLVGDSRDFAGCGWFVAASDYNKYVSCASDSNTVAYKVKTAQATYPGFVQDTLEFDNCGTEGCGSAWVIDAKGGDVRLNRPTAYDVGNSKLAHVENAWNVVITSHSDPILTNVTRGGAVGAGVVRILETNYNTGGNPTFYPANLPSFEFGAYGIDDFSHDGIRLGSAMTCGRLLRRANSIEFEIYMRGNGIFGGAKVDILPVTNYTGSGTPMDRGGSVYVGGLNGLGTIYYNLSKTNAAMVVTVTKIGSAGSETGLRVLIEPFSGTSSPTAHNAIFKVEAYVTPVGEDGNGKNHNIKEVGTYTGRSNLKLKGVDY